MLKALQEKEDATNDAECDNFTGFTCDTVGATILPYYMALLWLFYDQDLIYATQGIKKYDVIFYFMFNVIVIPFQYFVDILFMNVLGQYVPIQLADYAKVVKKR